MKKRKNVAKKICTILFWIAIWAILSKVVSNSILIASPWQTAKVLGSILKDRSFLLVIVCSLGRILLGFLLGVLMGTVLAFVSKKVERIQDLLEPVVLCVKAVPIASFVVLLLIWQGSKWLSLWISFLIVFPIFYTNVLEGLMQVPTSQKEVARVFGYGTWDQIWWIYRPVLRGYLESGSKLAVSMCIKAGVAAEIIGLPSGSFGEKLYMAKIYFSTDELFAWTILIVLAAFLCEKIIMKVVCWILRVKMPIVGARIGREKFTEAQIALENVEKSYGEKKVIKDFSLVAKKGDVIGIMAPSGAGKTTLFSILLGSINADGGNVSVNGRLTAVFQEPLLCEELDGLGNVKMGISRKGTQKGILQKLLSSSESTQTVKEYSLGMKRRCSIARALEKDADILLLDEPFASLDDTNRMKAIELIREYANERIVVIFTHNEEDIGCLDGKKFSLS